MITRRLLLKAGVLMGAGLLIPWQRSVEPVFAVSPPTGSLNPLSIPKYQMTAKGVSPVLTREFTPSMRSSPRG